MKDESPVAAVERVLSAQFGIHNPSAVQTMILIEAVQQALPPHPEATIASLRAILRDLNPHNGLENWAYRCAREITTWLSKQAKVSEISEGLDEGFWCSIEGTLTGMLMRVTRGLDLEVNETSSKE